MSLGWLSPGPAITRRRHLRSRRDAEALVALRVVARADVAPLEAMDDAHKARNNEMAFRQSPGGAALVLDHVESRSTRAARATGHTRVVSVNTDAGVLAANAAQGAATYHGMMHEYFADRMHADHLCHDDQFGIVYADYNCTVNKVLPDLALLLAGGLLAPGGLLSVTVSLRGGADIAVPAAAAGELLWGGTDCTEWLLAMADGDDAAEAPPGVASLSARRLHAAVTNMARHFGRVALPAESPGTYGKPSMCNLNYHIF